MNIPTYKKNQTFQQHKILINLAIKQLLKKYIQDNYNKTMEKNTKQKEMQIYTSHTYQQKKMKKFSVNNNYLTLK